MLKIDRRFIMQHTLYLAALNDAKCTNYVF